MKERSYKRNGHTQSLSQTEMNKTTVRQHLTKNCKNVPANNVYLRLWKDLAELTQACAVPKQCMSVGPS